MDGNELFYRAPGTQAPPVPDIGWLIAYRRIALAAVYVAIVLAAMTSQHARYLTSLGVVAALLFWISLDARIREKHFPHAAALPLAFTWPVGIAVYLVWTRGPGGLALYALAALVALLLGGAAALVVQVFL
jgi:hypothetical protein